MALWNSPWAAAPKLLWTLADASGHRASGAGGGVRPRQIADTFGAPRGRDRSHAGIDIFARRGTPCAVPPPASSWMSASAASVAPGLGDRARA